MARISLAVSLMLAVSSVLAVSEVSRAGLEEGKAALEQGDYATALHELTPLATIGDSRAQF